MSEAAYHNPRCALARRGVIVHEKVLPAWIGYGFGSVVLGSTLPALGKKQVGYEPFAHGFGTLHVVALGGCGVVACDRFGVRAISKCECVPLRVHFSSLRSGRSC
jgi:hypothetical protein